MGVFIRTGKDANPNGRPKGSSKKKFSYDVSVILKALGYCPFTHLVEMARDENWSKKERTQAAVELAQYVAPKLKAIEHTIGDENAGLSISFNFAPSQTANNAVKIEDER